MRHGTSDDAASEAYSIRSPRICAQPLEGIMRLSARNQLTGTVAAIEVGAVMTVVKVDLDGGQQITASITKDPAEDLGLTVGARVTAVVKSTEVMIGVD
jgi:molybdopterin-binding protein